MLHHNTAPQSHNVFYAKRLAPKVAAALCFAISCGAATVASAQTVSGGAAYHVDTKTGTETEHKSAYELTSPKPGQEFTAPATVTITIAPKATNTAKVQKVEFYVG